VVGAGLGSDGVVRSAFLVRLGVYPEAGRWPQSFWILIIVEAVLQHRSCSSSRALPKLSLSSPSTHSSIASGC